MACHYIYMKPNNNNTEQTMGKKNQLQVKIEKQDDGSYIAYNTNCDKLSLLGEGNTVKEAKEDFINSMDEVRASYQERGETIAELNNEPQFCFDLSSLFEFYKILNMSALAERIGINSSLLRQYKRGAYISDARLLEIEGEIHKIGEEFTQLRLVD